MKAIIKNKDSWLFFSNPQKILVTYDINDVIPILKEVTNSGLYAVGIISYEAAYAFDKAFPKKKSNQFPLVSFGLFKTCSNHDNLPELGEGTFQVGDFSSTVNKSEFFNSVKEIKGYIQKGETYQVNYTYRINASFDGNSYSFFKKLIANQESQYSSYIEMDNWSICSASPELFFQLNNNTLITRPMKGTSKRGRNLDEDNIESITLKNSIKNKAENIMIVDMLRNDLGKISKKGSVKTVSTFDTEKYSTLWQMTSTVKAETEKSVFDVLKALFPCASITGAPKFKTMEIINNIESTPREGYTGSIGYINPNGNALFNVAIRTAFINRKKNSISYGVGSGIVWDSDSDEEYNETKIKSQILLSERPSFDLVETMLWDPNKKIELLDFHLDRLQDSSNYFNRNFNRNQALKLINNFTDNYQQKIRLLLDIKGNLKLENFVLNNISSDKILRIKLASKPIDSSDPFLFHKTTYRDVYESAVNELSQYSKKIDDILLWNESMELTEGTIFNVAVKRDGKWITPLVSCGLLGGVKRRDLINKKILQEGIIKIDELSKKDEFLLFNSVRGYYKAVII